MATAYFKPNLNSLRPGYEIVGVSEDAQVAAGGDITITFESAFATAPSVLSIVCEQSNGVATASVKSVSTTQIVLTYAATGLADDVKVSAIVQGLVS
jgi:hypothetical protein